MHEFESVLDQHTILSREDFEILLLYLSRDSGAIAYDGQTIRFRSKNDAASVITHQDSTISSIKSLISTTSKQVQDLEYRISELTAAAKLALENKNRVSALSALRSRKLAERNLGQRSDTLAQLEEVYSAIDRAAAHVGIVQAMESGADVLRALHTEIGGTDRAERVVQDMQEEMAQANDIGDIVAESGGAAVDESEIDEELEAMEEAEQQKKEDKEFEETIQRLAGIEKATTTGKLPEQQSQNFPSDLANSIGRLSDLSIEEHSVDKGKLSEGSPAK